MWFDVCDYWPVVIVVELELELGETCLPFDWRLIVQPNRLVCDPRGPTSRDTATGVYNGCRTP